MTCIDIDALSLKGLMGIASSTLINSNPQNTRHGISYKINNQSKVTKATGEPRYFFSQHVELAQDEKELQELPQDLEKNFSIQLAQVGNK